MKIKKIISAVLAEAAAAAMLALPTEAAYLGDNEPTFDMSAVTTAYKQNDAKSEFYTDIDGNKLDGLLYCDFSDGYDLGANMLLVRFEDGKIVKRNYTGFTKDEDGRRYYLNGRRFYGWNKIKDKWYHFDLSTGCADTGKTKIGGAYYTFDSKGRWTGKYTKSGKVPADFSLRFISNADFGFDTAEKKIYFGKTESGIAERDIKISKEDMTVLYSIYRESGFEQGGSADFSQRYLSGVYEKLVSEAEEVRCYNTEPEIYFNVTAKKGGAEAKVSFSDDAEQITHIDEAAFRAYRMKNCYYRYLLGLESKYPYMGDEEIWGLD